LSRGYRPVATFSAHFIADARFRDAVADFLEVERRAAIREIAALGDFAPFRRS
jgi:hypothetical protein